MAPHLATSQHVMIEALITSGAANPSIARVVGCSDRAVRRIRKTLRRFGSTLAPKNRVGRRPALATNMLDTLLGHLAAQPDPYRDEMIDFLEERCGVRVSPSTITRSLTSVGWSRKTSRRVAQQRDPDLRDLYMYKLSAYKSFHLVFIDESGCDRRHGHRRMGWAPLGTPPKKVEKFSRDKRHQILPAYTQDGILLSGLFSGTTEAAFFEDFIAQLLHHCDRYPEPKSVLVMDNASIHRSPRVHQMCTEAGVKLLYLPPYSPDFNPIEEFFAELKAFIKHHWRENEGIIEVYFKGYLQWCIDMVGPRRSSAEGHFRHAGIEVEQVGCVG